MIITIDGPAGSGKSTVARLLASRLRLRFLDTGAMYRAVALAVLRAGVDETDVPGVTTVARSACIEFHDHLLLLNGDDVTDAIRTPAVTAVSSVIAALPEVRARLVELQKEIGRQGSLVTEGRDQGTVVFPQAEYKFYLTASTETRARRRQRDLQDQGESMELPEVRAQLARRDHRDQNREHAPLRPADDAVLVDTSDLTIQQVVDSLVARISPKPARECHKAPPGQSKS